MSAGVGLRCKLTLWSPHPGQPRPRNGGFKSPVQTLPAAVPETSAAGGRELLVQSSGTRRYETCGACSWSILCPGFVAEEVAKIANGSEACGAYKRERLVGPQKRK
ncbi:hypothetical protein ACLMJK_004111 [Lecanora helva]